MPKQILHDAHREHPLVLHPIAMAGLGFGFDNWSSTPFRCDGCRCIGAGSRYRCDACDFDLHEACATCPPTTLSPFHGQHPLKLELEPDVPPYVNCVCELCDTAIEGMHYSCRPCGFDVHPVCSQLPAAAVSPLHPEHLVMLTVAPPRKCTRCSDFCSWRYRCSPCGVNLHPRCLLGSDKTPLGIPRDSGRLARGFFL